MPTLPFTSSWTKQVPKHLWCTSWCLYSLYCLTLGATNLYSHFWDELIVIYLILKSGLCAFKAQHIWSLTPCPILSFLGALRQLGVSSALNVCSWRTPEGRWMWECASIGKMIPAWSSRVIYCIQKRPRVLTLNVLRCTWRSSPTCNLLKGKENFLIQVRHLNFLKRICWWLRCPPEGAGFDPKMGSCLSSSHFFSSQEFRTQL